MITFFPQKLKMHHGPLDMQCNGNVKESSGVKVATNLGVLLSFSSLRLLLILIIIMGYELSVVEKINSTTCAPHLVEPKFSPHDFVQLSPYVATQFQAESHLKRM